MRILHTSDWHLGKRLEEHSRIEEQKEILDEIVRIAEEHSVDAVVVAGDLFDTFNPTTEATELLYRSLKRLTGNGSRPVIAIAGNHDSPDRIESPDPLARECGIIFIGYPGTVVPPFKLDTGVEVTASEEGFAELRVPGADHPLRILHTAYANEFRLKTYLGADDGEQELRSLLSQRWSDLVQRHCDANGCNLLVSHLFFIKEGDEVKEEPDDEKPILHVGGAQAIFSGNVPDGLQYVALGHLHRKQVIDSRPCPIVYSGSPLSYSFAETNQDKFVLLVDLIPGRQAEITEVKLNGGKRLLRYRANSVDEAVRWLRENENALVEVTIVSDTYITAQERKQLHEAHQGIIAVVPEIMSSEDSSSSRRSADLSKSTEELFRDYFMKEKGQAPNESLVSIFKEIMAEEEEA